MESSVYVMGNRMHCLAESMQAVSANLANADTPGYKRTTNCFEALLKDLSLAGRPERGTMAPRWPRLVGPSLDTSSGPVRRTGRPLDLALKGDGFFVVNTPRGERYTRKGRIHLDRTGQMVDARGNPFMSDGGTLSVPEGAGEIAVGSDGQVSVGGEVLGKLRVVSLPRPDRLAAEGWGLYRNDGPPARPALEPQVLQGAIEGSNVRPVHEMVGMIGIMRAYEASSRIVKRLDSLNSQLIRSAT